MIAGVNGSPKLFSTDVSGNYLEYRANAIGENDEKIKEKLRQDYKQDLTCEEGIKLALKIFKDVQGENFDKNRFDVGIIKKEKNIEKLKGSDF